MRERRLLSINSNSNSSKKAEHHVHANYNNQCCTDAIGVCDLIGQLHYISGDTAMYDTQESYDIQENYTYWQKKREELVHCTVRTQRQRNAIHTRL